MVALRKESVDRNGEALYSQSTQAVALRKESVDRNDASAWASVDPHSRSPQGERG